MLTTFILSQSIEKHHKFIDYLNTCHENMTFAGEPEKENKLPFQDFLSSRNGTTVTFSGVFTNVTSYIDTRYKHGLLYAILHQGFVICCIYEKLYTSKSIFQRIVLWIIVFAYFWISDFLRSK